VGYEHDVPEVETVDQIGEIIAELLHGIALPWLVGPTVTAPVVRDYAISPLPEEQHLIVPRVAAERPSVREHNGLTRAPVLVEYLRAALVLILLIA
jgi:hypothetical protein